MNNYQTNEIMVQCNMVTYQKQGGRDFMKKRISGLFIGVTLVLAACGGNGGGDTDITAGNEKANKLYQNKCAQCHGQNLEGGVGEDLTKIGSKMSAEEILSFIEEGSGVMPPKLLTGEDAQEVADWLAEKK